MNILAIALLVVLVAGCGAPGPTADGAADHAEKAARLQVGLDVPSSGAPGYRVDFVLQALSKDGSESYAWTGNVTFRFTATDSDSNNGVVQCHAAGPVIEVSRSVRLTDFYNDVPPFEHWSLPLSVQDAKLGDGHYRVAIHAQMDKTHNVLESQPEFTHCGASGA